MIFVLLFFIFFSINEMQFVILIQIGTDPKYLTTVIPYHLENGTPDNQALQVLIKSKLSFNNRILSSKFQFWNSHFFFFRSTQGHQWRQSNRTDAPDGLYSEGVVSNVNSMTPWLRYTKLSSHFSLNDFRFMFSKNTYQCKNWTNTQIYTILSLLLLLCTIIIIIIEILKNSPL